MNPVKAIDPASSNITLESAPHSYIKYKIVRHDLAEPNKVAA